MIHKEWLINAFGILWYNNLSTYIESKEFLSLSLKISKERENNIIYPSREDLFKCFRLCPYDKMKVVILGQDPYHDGSADGLAFSNSKTSKLSPSLRNIMNEIKRSYPKKGVISPDLSKWADQGVLLLNTAQTVKEKEPESHLELWVEFTNAVIRAINLRNDVIWLLLGAKAHYFEPKIQKYHCVLKTSHPSPLSVNRGFTNSGIFLRCNEELDKRNLKEINW